MALLRWSNLGSIFHVNINCVTHMEYIWQHSGKNVTVISAIASEDMRDEDDSPYLSQDDEHENEDFSTTVESHVNCDTINVSIIISKV